MPVASPPSLQPDVEGQEALPTLTSSSAAAASTSAVTRSWSDVDRVKLMSTFALTSFAYSFLGQPFFFAIARQQCCRQSISAMQIVRDVVRAYGVRGLYRGAGAAISGTVISELVYYGTVEYFKEKLPMKDREWRSFGGGMLADFFSAPVFNPFAVVSQVQMVAGSSFAGGHNYMSAYRTAMTLVREQGFGCLFRGTVLTLLVTPLTGAWWFVYECFKRVAYDEAPRVGDWLGRVLPARLIAGTPQWMRSHTDNPLINCSVGAAASMVMGVIMNPIFVVRLRLQVGTNFAGLRFPLFTVLRETVAEEGFRAFWKGLGVNLFTGVVGGCAFGVTYEGSKQFSDKGVEKV